MGIHARNAIYFNPQGNILLLGGFGNLAHGRIEIWEVKKHKKLIATCMAPATTQLEWLDDGIHFITATTAPRMQVSNEFTVWNYKGIQVYKWKAEKHLFGIVPLKYEPPLPFAEDELDKFVKSLVNKPPVASKFMLCKYP
jgi:translation initiation factor 2A